MQKEIFLSPAKIAEITSGKWENLSDSLSINEIHETYHYLKKGDMFVVHYDDWYNKSTTNEHKVAGAVKKGISSVMLRDDSKLDINTPTLRVKNTYNALRKIALYTSKKSKAKRVLITGSYGKTGFKIQLNDVVKNQINTYTRFNSSNMVVATYCNLASLKKDTELFLIEQPVSTLEKTFRRASYVKPDISVITSIGHEGIERFKTIDNIIQNKLQIARALSDGGKLLLPYDDRYYDQLLTEAKKYQHIKILTYGSSRTCNATLIYKSYSNFGWDIIARIEDKVVSYRVPFFEEYAVSASLGVLLCAYHLGLDVFRAANEYYKCKNFKSSGLFNEVLYKEKKFFLYDQSNRGGIEGYESFFKTLSYIKPQNRGKKILVTSEFVDYKDGEMGFIDLNYFQKIVEESGIETIFSVEKFSEHINVLKDKSIWKNHSIDFNNIKDEIIDTLQNDDILCIKGIFDSTLPKFIEYIKNLNGIIIKEIQHKNETLTYDKDKFEIILLDRTYLSKLREIQSELYVKGSENWFSESTFNRYIDEKHVYGVVLKNDKSRLISSCVIKERGEWMEIFQISVRKSYQKMGIGGGFLIYCVNKLLEQNKKLIYLTVDINNTNAISVYKKFGFQITKTKKKYFLDTKDAYVMEFLC